MEPTPDRLRALFTAMVRIRTFEETVAALVEQGKIRCPAHLAIGQEAAAAGVCAALNRADSIWGAHRSHGHYLAKGADMNAAMAEMFGKATGCSRGRGGSMHLVAPEAGIFGTVPIVGATIPMAVGAALASKQRRDGRVAVSFFGDGAMEEGVFHESMNVAAVWKLPVVFACENNLYSSHLGLLERRAKDNLVDSAAAHGMPGARGDGNDVVEVHRLAVEAVERARRGEGPTFLELRTYRWRGHVGPKWDDDVGVKRKDELKDWMPRCPIKRVRDRIAGAEAIERAARAEVDAAVAFAEASPYPDASELADHLFK